ncbi:MAG: hypothetical protein ACSHXY_12870 [Alphaproteobacteria bacterium]
MKLGTLVTVAFVGSLMMVPAVASAGSSSATNTCRTANGSLCPPKRVQEKIVPEYYNVPTKVKHIRYQKPVVKPVVTHIIHHVPVPVYGGKVITENVNGGVWKGPAIGCCNGRPAPQPRQQVVCSTPRHPQHRPQGCR